MSNLHIVAFPWFATGHMTPFLHLSNELAARGHRITFLLPKKALSLLEPLNRHPHLISFHVLAVPHVAGLPPATETASDVPHSLAHLLAVAYDLTRPQVADLLRSARPDLVLFDFGFWVPEVAAPLGVKSVLYAIVSAAAVAITVVPGRGDATAENPFTEEELRHPPPGYPSSTVVLRGAETRSLHFLSMPFGDGITFHQRMMTSFRECDAIAVRTCEEMEGHLCAYLATHFRKKVLLTGPALTAPPNATTSLDEKWAKWLTQFPPKSVIFCAFGSQVILEKDQLGELVLGIEETGRPFLVALKAPLGFGSIGEALPEGFEERTRERGVVHGGWVQQPLILKHPSVGCFVSHCGFSSMWESLISEAQIVLVPTLDDQILNTRLLAEELKVGVEVKREEDRSFTRHSVREAIEAVMVDEDVNRNHAKWKQRLTEPGFMEGYIDNFVKDLQNECS